MSIGRKVKLLTPKEWEKYDLTEEEFHKLDRTRRYRLRHPDRARAAQLKWRRANAEYNRERQRPYHLKYKYGITVEEYEVLLETQNHRCAICNTDSPSGKWKVFAVDHCHDTGEVRGLLCNECNRGMGLLGDDHKRLEAASAYLKRHRKITNDARSRTVE
jgi:hypothetical protein